MHGFDMFWSLSAHILEIHYRSIGIMFVIVILNVLWIITSNGGSCSEATSIPYWVSMAFILPMTGLSLYSTSRLWKIHNYAPVELVPKE